MTSPSVREVAAYHRAALVGMSLDMSDDPRYVTGLSWGIRALDRVLRACDGETDPTLLGMAAEPAGPEQAGLFDGEATL